MVLKQFHKKYKYTYFTSMRKTCTMKLKLVTLHFTIHILQQLFTINQQTGDVQTKIKLDRDRASVVTLTVHVVDVTATPQQTGTGNLIINILEYNDQHPQFLPYNNVTIDEEQPIGTFVMALLATDQDDPIAEYQIIQNPNDFFAIGYQTGNNIINLRYLHI